MELEGGPTPQGSPSVGLPHWAHAGMGHMVGTRMNAQTACWEDNFPKYRKAHSRLARSRTSA